MSSQQVLLFLTRRVCWVRNISRSDIAKKTFVLQHLNLLCVAERLLEGNKIPGTLLDTRLDEVSDKVGEARLVSGDLGNPQLQVMVAQFELELVPPTTPVLVEPDDSVIQTQLTFN